jgi:hypothetical protein
LRNQEKGFTFVVCEKNPSGTTTSFPPFISSSSFENALERPVSLNDKAGGKINKEIN